MLWSSNYYGFVQNDYISLGFVTRQFQTSSNYTDVLYSLLVLLVTVVTLETFLKYVDDRQSCKKPRRAGIARVESLQNGRP